MNYIEKLIHEKCPNGVVFEPLKNLIVLSKGKQLNKSLLSKKGQYPVYNGGMNPSGYWHEKNTKKNTIIISSGGRAGYVQFIWEDFWAGGDCFIVEINSEKINQKYLFHFLLNNQNKILNMAHGAVIKHLSKDKIYQIKIPVPPLEIQTKIVKILDKFTELTTELTIELKNRAKQYEYYRNKLLTFKEHSHEA